MNATIAKFLIERGVIRQGTVLEAYQSVKGLSCVCDSVALTRYVVLRARASDGWVFFDVVSSPTDRKCIRCDFIATIDGMPVERVVAAHQLRSPPRRKQTKRKRPPPALPSPPRALPAPALPVALPAPQPVLKLPAPPPVLLLQYQA